MAKFKVGDQVRLKSDPAMAKAHDSQERHVKGEVIEVTEEGYTVVLYDETLISKKGLTDDNLELDK
jgi:ribosomal protein L21E